MFVSPLIAALLCMASVPRTASALSQSEAASVFQPSTMRRLASPPIELSESEVAAVRKNIYGRPLAESAPPPNSFKRTLLAPEPVRRAYAAKPTPTIELLLRIADGADPSDSILATSYVLELCGGPGVGLMYIHLFDWDTYDQPDKTLKATPREHAGQFARDVYEKSLTKKR